MKDIKINNVQRLSHTTWNCKYHKFWNRNIEEKYFMKVKDWK